MVLGFDAPFAHPTSSFNEPVQPPDVEPDEGELVQVCFSVAWLALVQGALSQLQLQSTWLGDADAVLLAQGRATNLKGLFANPVCAVPEVETPYWDTEEDVDDNAPADDQPWYGYVLDAVTPPNTGDFISDATIYFFEGLIVASLGLVGIAPAVAFKTLASNFVVSYKNDGPGSIIRFFIDGVKIYQGVDTGTGEITDVPVVADPSVDLHQLYMTAEIP